MEIAGPSIEALRQVITGNPLDSSESTAPYRSGPDLVNFFNQFGANDRYQSSGFPSRWLYAQNRLESYNGKPVMKEICEAAVDPRHFLGSDYTCDQAVDYLNKFLDYDGYVLTRVGKQFQVIDRQEETLEIGRLLTGEDNVNRQFIQEQLEKCDRKLVEGDYTGAITNSRSLVEGVLREIEDALCDDPPRYNGKLSPLYNRVYSAMNLDPGQEGLSSAARELLSGLISVVSGLAPIRNSASDAHALEYRPKRHHAELAVNCAKTIVRFLADSLEYQLQNDLLQIDPT